MTLSVIAFEPVIISAKKYINQLQHFCSPIQQYFDITSIGIILLSNNELINLHTSPNWIDYCAIKANFKDDPHILHPNNMHPGFALCSTYLGDSYQNNILTIAEQKFNQYHAISYVEKSEHGYLAISFATHKDNIQFPTIMLNDLEIIKAFAKYLSRELLDANIQQNMVANNINLADLKGDLFYTQHGIVTKEEKHKASKLELLKQIGLINNNYSGRKLSAQEKRCVNHYLNGYSARETATILGLSHRTVETYIENVKNKLGYQVKRDILSKRILLNYLDLL